VSFDLAAQHLGMPVVHFDVRTSSESKGEIIEDTLQTLIAMGIRLVVVRHAQDGLPAMLAKQCGESACIINAGDGTHAHPSQALLDLMTIMESKPDVSRLKIAVVGNIRHSRVANSLQSICAILGVGELVLIAPEIWQPTFLHYGHYTTSLYEGLSDADVVICLRVQKERLSEGEHLDLGGYHHDYGITNHSLSYAKKDAMVMHPGPINRGVEMDSDVVSGPQSVIFKQVTNGVFMRMAILERLIVSRI
jgi:aspartate carbamoyltransferase catalytic subunit